MAGLQGCAAPPAKIRSTVAAVMQDKRVVDQRADNDVVMFLILGCVRAGGGAPQRAPRLHTGRNV
ncbi:hypothetical protein BST14_10765 [Mycobacterium arosiense ATCC BAA-1401 = DSM 45069]|uniref:Uncharacterized protein n=1 Tax=Mycobacterium arosiense ATCC BAA-1401 = DSM 45069 TaxID=1265311 RepID=A0A1W9ZJA8_MYCAI|nr:hypothetical protein BST14_10765 [Mycobacterium arosiense ATCC BAA-1401 = DSM 45069]